MKNRKQWKERIKKEEENEKKQQATLPQTKASYSRVYQFTQVGFSQSIED